mmetsp:Transcript_5687/g.21553  ORF Transcript_5687/g.21553 Transcript_5687/m.21553 type:complete len:123 (-) Transcript_5687:101-469(-)
MPCPKVGALGGCPDGMLCKFCHMPHTRSTKPGKNQRQRYRQFVVETMRLIEENPHTFDPSAIEFPTPICENVALRTKFVKRMINHLELAKAGRAAESDWSMAFSAGILDQAENEQTSLVVSL